jgi:hypothetical protein
MSRAKPMIALSCLLDLLFVLIFAALLMDDPAGETSNTQNSAVIPLAQYTDMQARVNDILNEMEGYKQKNQELTNLVKEKAALVDKVKRISSTNQMKLLTELKQTQEAKRKLQQSLSKKTDANVQIHSLKGLWTGEGCQTGTRSCWSIKINMPYLANYPFTKSIGDFEMSYPSLNCKAIWSFIKNESGALRFQERITSGRCTNNGIITLTKRVDSGLSFEWQKGRDRAYGTLYQE